jgi:acyl carrier protein
MMDERIRRVLAEHARITADLGTLSDDADLYQAGMTSRGSVNVMLALEEAFDVELPEDMLRRSTFQSVSAIRAAITELLSQDREG